MSEQRAQGLDHVAIAVKDLDVAVRYYVEVLGFAPPELEEVAAQKVRTAIFGHGLGRIELICPTEPGTVVAKFLEKRGEGLHHVCVEVDDLVATLAALKAQGRAAHRPDAPARRRRGAGRLHSPQGRARRADRAAAGAEGDVSFRTYALRLPFSL